MIALLVGKRGTHQGHQSNNKYGKQIMSDPGIQKERKLFIFILDIHISIYWAKVDIYLPC